MAIINGTAGDDLILGGLGGNTLTGGLGADLFQLSALNLPPTPNIITDFAPLDDTIQVDLPSDSQPTDLTTVQTGKDAVINFGGTQLAVVQNTLVNDLNDIVVVVTTDAPPPTPTPPPGPIAGIVLAANQLTTDPTVIGFGISAVSQKAGNKVNEIGVFIVDDASGKIGGIAPGAAGYLQAASDTARPIFSTLNGSFFNTNKREIGLESNKIYQFFQVQDGSIADFQQQLASGKTPTNIVFSIPDPSGNSPIKIANNNANDGYKVSVNNDELVLNVVRLDGNSPNLPIGSQSQGLVQGRTLDLADFAGKTLKANITTTSSAAYNNNIGFYAVEDEIGTIQLANGSTLQPGDANYAIEAIKSAILQTGKTDSKTNQDIAGGKIYAPVVIAQGSFTDFVTRNPTNGGDGNAVHAYFNYLGANPDKVDHFRLLGDNTFGVEDVFGGGDRDFNDLVFKATFQA
jgi:hypothetical protein